jgi:hypothetical protein
LVRLAALIDWQRIEMVCVAGFSSRRGRPASSARLIAGLLYQRHGMFGHPHRTGLPMGAKMVRQSMLS